MRQIVIGDVHGCLSELDQLLKLVDFKRGRDRLIFVGDLMDRGPDSIGVVRRVRELRGECLTGNHEAKHLRYHEHELKRAQDRSYKNPMQKLSDRKQAFQDGLSEADWKFLGSLPLWIKLAENLYVVHAGCLPGIPVESQPREALTMLRYLRRATGKMLSMHSDELATPDVAAYWTEVWTGPETIIYGHHPTDKNEPGIDEVAPGVKCVCVDTGCCYGGALTAAILPDWQFVSVKASQEYAEKYARKYKR